MAKRRGLEERDKFWEGHLRQWKSSGLSQAEYCRENELNSKTFGYWKRKKKFAGDALCLVEIPVQRQPIVSYCSTPVRLMVGSRYRIEVEKNFDTEALDQLILFLDRR